MRAIAEAVGWFVILLFVLGTLGIGDFRLTLKHKAKDISIHGNTIVNCQSTGSKNKL